MERIKKTLFFLEEKLPIIGKPLLYLIRLTKHHFVYGIHAFKAKRISGIDDGLEIYWINPETIKYFSKDAFDRIKDRGKVLAGDWDTDIEWLDNSTTYKGLKERFVDGKKWSETEYYRRAIKSIKDGITVWECRNKDQFHERLQRIDELYADIKNHGYKLKTDDKKVNVYSYSLKRINGYEKLDEIQINIDRNGKTLLNDGHHRLSIAKLLGLAEVPAMVIVRHRKWVEFKNELILYAKSQGGRLYQRAYHFDLENIPFIHGDERVNLIKENLNSKTGKLLDIGTYFGYFCHELEKEGFECSAVEINRQRVRFMKKLREANKDKFEIIQSSIFDIKKDKIASFDIVLAINIFHHFLKNKKEYRQLQEFLADLDCRELFFESHNPGEDQMKNSLKNYSADEFVKFIKEHTGLRQHRFIKEFPGGRKLYKLF